MHDWQSAFVLKIKNTELPVLKIQTVFLAISGSNLLLIFHNNLTAEFWPTFSYGLLLQRFFWKFCKVFVISIKADTRNYSKKYQQFSLLEAISFEQWVPFMRQFPPPPKIFTINEIGIFHIIAEWCLFFFAKFRSHRVENEKKFCRKLSHSLMLLY